MVTVFSCTCISYGASMTCGRIMSCQLWAVRYLSCYLPGGVSVSHESALLLTVVRTELGDVLGQRSGRVCLQLVAEVRVYDASVTNTTT